MLKTECVLEFALTDLNTAMPQLNMPSNICSYSAKDPIFYLINVITPHSGLIIPEVSAFGAPAMTKEEFEREQRIPFDEKVEPIYEELRNKDIEAKVVLLKGDPQKKKSLNMR